MTTNHRLVPVIDDFMSGKIIKFPTNRTGGTQETAPQQSLHPSSREWRVAELVVKSRQFQDTERGADLVHEAATLARDVAQDNAKKADPAPNSITTADARFLFKIAARRYESVSERILGSLPSEEMDIERIAARTQIPVITSATISFTGRRFSIGDSVYSYYGNEHADAIGRARRMLEKAKGDSGSAGQLRRKAYIAHKLIDPSRYMAPELDSQK